MNGEREIEGISIPFAAGVGLAAFLMQNININDGIAAIAVRIIPATVLTLSVFALRHTGKTLFSAIYFLIGLFCFFSDSFLLDLSPSESFPLEAVKALRNIISSIPFPSPNTGPLITAMLTGDRSLLSSEIREVFRASGASHILALSGLHLGVIYMLIHRILLVLGNSRASRIVRSALTVCAATFYTLMTGASPSTVRALIFIVIRELSSILPGRSGSASRTLMLTLTIHLAISPSSICELSFQLSYLAMIGIVFLYPRMEKLYPVSGRFDIFARIWKSICLSTSCQIFTGPLVWLKFGTFPKYFLIANLLALPLTSAIMVTSVLTITLSAFGCTPDPVITLNDSLARLLLRILETVSAM